jgi:hypothetical protein
MTSALTAFLSRAHSLRSREPRRPGGTESRRRSRTRAWGSLFEVLEGRIALTAFLVTNPLDGPGAGPTGSLRNAIALAEQSGGTNDVVVITPAVKGTIALDSGELAIDASMTIVNRSGRPIEIRQTMPGDRVFDVTSDALAAVVNIGSTSARDTITIDGGSLSTGDGGGILVQNPANVLTLTHVRVIGNSAGLASSSGGVQDGGGVDSEGRIVLVQSAVGTDTDPNQASGDGGGIWAGAGVSMTASTVVGNQAGDDGGGLYVSSGNATLSRSRIDGNGALNVGGIDEVQGEVRVVSGSKVDGNSSTAQLDVAAGNFGGGGISVGAGDVFVSRSEVDDNHSLGMYSSGIVIGLGNVTVTSGSRVDGNTNNGPGGGIAANFGGVVTVTGKSQVDHNTGAGLGGGIVNFAGPSGGVRILGGSEVDDNTLTTGETVGQAIGVFLEVIADSLGLDFDTATGGTSASALSAEISSLDQGIASTAGAPSASIVAGGGIATLLGASITVAGGSHVDDNLAGAQPSGGNSNSIGVGGGLFAARAPINVAGSTVDDDTARGSGGGIWNGASLTVTGSTIAGNGAVLSPGGGLFNSTGANASIVRSTLRSNSAALGGGADNLGTLNLLGSTVTRNRAAVQGGGIAGSGKSTLIHTRVVANTPDDVAPTT